MTLFALASTPRRAEAQGTALWQIGQADHDDKEFALAPNGWHQYQQDSVYIVGQSHPETDWSYVQPGPEDSWAGNVPHTSEIYFSLAQATDQGDCHLTLALIDSQQNLPPRLQITVNGQSWTRDTPSGGGDDSINGQPDHGKPTTFTIDFPASLLHTGTNEVSISSIRGSWFVYDTVSLSAPAGDTLGTAPPMLHLISAEWLHDVLTKQGGKLQQVLQDQFYNSGAPQDVTLHVSGEADCTVTVPNGRSTLETTYPESHQSQQTRVQIVSAAQSADAALITDRQPCRRYTIYCIEHSHLDIGYAYPQPVAIRLHRKYVTDGLKMSAQATGLPSDDRFRWNVESLFEIDGWLKQATPEQIAAFRHAVRNGDLGLSALYCNELTGLCRPEELAALLDCANEIRTKYNVPIDSAMITDVPGYTWGMVSLLAQGGVKYFSWGPNLGDHVGSTLEQDNKAFYWVSPSGKERVMVWQGPHGYQPSFDPNAPSLMHFLKEFDRQFPHDPYDMIYDRYTQGDNGPANTDLPGFVHQWNSRYAYPHLKLATTSQMFHDFAAHYGKTLPQVRGDDTGYWEDGAASTAAETAINRAAAEKIAQDQILWSMLGPAHYPHARFAEAWRNAVLYDEHTWGAYNSWSEPESDFVKNQWAYKRQYALNARQQGRSLQNDAFKTVAGPSSSHTVAVFNTCSWKRTDLVILPARISQVGDRVQNERGQDVPSQRLSDGSLAFLALDIPTLSSRKFTVVAGQSRYHGSASASIGVLKTSRMSLRIDPQTGAITSWKTYGSVQNLVNAEDKTCRGLNDYLYVLGPSNSHVQFAGNAKLTMIDNGPLVASLRIDSDAPGARSLSRVVQVVDDLDQVRIADTIDKLAVHEDEAVHLGFSFGVPGGTVRMDMPWSVVRPNVDQTKYANRNVFPVSRWADVSNGAYGVTCAVLDSPMMQIGGITLPRENAGGWLATAKTGSTLYWNVMNNYWHTNYKAYQSGPVTFRYTLHAHGRYDQTSAQQFGIGQSQPLLFTPIQPGQPDAQMPLTLSNDAILVTMCHPAADGKGWQVRLFNGSDRAQALHIGWRGNHRVRLTKTDLWGNGGQPLTSPLSLAPLQTITIRVDPK